MTFYKPLYYGVVVICQDLKHVFLIKRDCIMLFLRHIRDLHISGDAGEVKVGRAITEAFIGGNAELFSSGLARNVDIVGDVDEFSAGRIVRVGVGGSTTHLNVNWGAFHSEFHGPVASAFLGGPVRNVAVNGDVIFGRNEIV